MVHIDGQELKGDIHHSRVMLEKDEEKSIGGFLSLVADLEQQGEELMIESSNKTIGSCEFEVNKLNMIASIVEGNPSFGIVSSGAEVCLARHNEEEDVMLEEVEREILLLENLLKESESNCELEPQVSKLCFNNFDEEMKYLEERISKDESVEDSVRMLPNSDKGKDNLLQ